MYCHLGSEVFESTMKELFDFEIQAQCIWHTTRNLSLQSVALSEVPAATDIRSTTSSPPPKAVHKFRKLTPWSVRLE